MLTMASVRRRLNRWANVAVSAVIAVVVEDANVEQVSLSFKGLAEHVICMESKVVAESDRGESLA